MHAHRDWRNRLILFEDVDVSTPVERTVGDRKQVIPMILRSANSRSVLELHNEIRQAQSSEPEQTGVFPLMRLYLLIPAFIRGLIFRIPDRSPHLMKKNGGTVMLTNVGLFGNGGGWGIPIASHSLNVTVGGIVNRPLLAPGGLEEREHLCLTVSFDHDIIDGAPAARFLQRFKEIIEEGEALKELASQRLTGADSSTSSGPRSLRLLPNADRYIAPGMGHEWMAEAPDLHCRMVPAWLRDAALPENPVRASKE